MQQQLWVDKYRPTELDDFILDDEIKLKIASILDGSQSLPHFIFEGSFGLGKTSLAQFIASKLDAVSLYKNSSVDTSIDIIREDVTQFCNKRSKSNFKIVIFDEAEKMSLEAQDALKGFIEKYQTQGIRFIFTTNHYDKINDGIKSRCTTVTFKEPTKRQIYYKLAKILNTEEIAWQKDDLVSLVNETSGDIRSSIKRLQELSVDGEFIYDAPTSTDLISQIIEALNSPEIPVNKYKNIKQIIVNNNIKNFEILYSQLYEKLDEWVDENSYVTSTVILNQYSYQSRQSYDKELNFMAFISELFIQ